MVPLGSVVQVSQSYGPDRVFRYNGYPDRRHQRRARRRAIRAGQAQAAMERILAETLPNGMKYEWTDLTYQEIIAGNSSVFVFPLCVLLVVLVLAAQYESWTLPLAIVAIVPMALLSAIIGVWLTGGDNNIFTQIGLFVLVGLASKNAILIVEFAKHREKAGVDPVAAALEAARLRLRPILMTSIAFIMGVVPLVLASGAGAEMRHAIGIAVFSGMIGVTFFGLFLTPVFYVLLRAAVLRSAAARRSLPSRMRKVRLMRNYKLLRDCCRRWRCSPRARSGRTITRPEIATPDQFVGVDAAQFSHGRRRARVLEGVQRPAVERAHRAMRSPRITTCASRRRACAKRVRCAAKRSWISRRRCTASAGYTEDARAANDSSRRRRSRTAIRTSTTPASTRSGSWTSSAACVAASKRARPKCSRPKPACTRRRSS